MFESSIVKGTVFTDDSGIAYEIPILLTPSGPLYAQIKYLVAQWDRRSPSWMIQMTFSLRLFMEYWEKHCHYSDERLIFQNFRQRLKTGTISDATDFGVDTTELYWEPKRPKLAQKIIFFLTDFFDWWDNTQPSRTNPADQWCGNAYDERLAQVAYQYRRNKAFLGHTWSTTVDVSRNSEKSRRIHSGKKSPSTETAVSAGFPEHKVLELIFNGFKVGSRYNYRDMLITLLMNGAGFRVSEIFHLYLWDVIEDPQNKGSALVLIHHPEWGDAPADPKWIGSNGKKKSGNRAAYLAERFGLAPRNRLIKTAAAGWKGGAHERTLSGFYKQAYWFVPEYGKLFWELWHAYVRQVMQIAPMQRHHPYAFMNVAREPKGSVYKMGKFQDSYQEALARIGMVCAFSDGTNIHSHRHAYGRRLRRAGVPREMIRLFMHHSDIDSQDVYTQADHNECLQYLQKAMANLNSMADEERSRIVKVSSYDIARFGRTND